MSNALIIQIIATDTSMELHDAKFTSSMHVACWYYLNSNMPTLINSIFFSSQSTYKLQLLFILLGNL